MPRKPMAEPRVVLYVRMDPDTAMEVRELADQAGSTVNDFVVQAVREYNVRQKKAAKKAAEQMELVG